MPHARRQRAIISMLATAGIGLPANAQPVSHDFNADGYSDFPVSLTGYEPAGPVTGAARIWSGASKTVIHTIVAPDTNTLFGWSVGSAGDIDADGYDDLIVGEPLWNPTGQLNGRIHVFSGDDASTLLTVVGPYTETALGRYVTGVGDWNGDGTPDIAASGWDIADLDSDGIGDDPIGLVFVFSGVDGSVLAEISDPAATPMFGYSVFGLGDITGDGYADIAIVDRHAPGTSGAEGQLSIFTGRASVSALTLTDAHRVLSNNDPSIRAYAAQVDTMHPDLWLSEPTLQIISLTDDDAEGGPNEAASRIDIVETSGASAGTKGERSSLVLAGDINLDGKVDAQDLQVSISQLGTNPQAAGVMPIADMNNDQIVDSYDVALLLNGYGTSTDVYEGLWDGSRLLAVVAGSTGFGNTTGAGLSGSAHVAPGRRPVEDCLRGEIPPDGSAGLVPALLRSDARSNCSRCPSYLNSPNCYECLSDEGVTGGSVTASPEQPLINQEVVFSVTGVSETPATVRCTEGCGDDRRTAQTQVHTPRFVWQVMTKGPDGWPDELDPNDVPHALWPTGDSITVPGGAACEEKKAICWAAPTDCIPDREWTRIGEKIVKFADFTICYATLNPSPLGVRRRTKIGLLEQVDLVIVEDVAVTWSITFPDDRGTVDIPFAMNSMGFGALYEPGTITVEATHNGCTRTLEFQVVAPSSVRFDRREGEEWHNSGIPSAFMMLCVTVLPEDVSFAGLTVGEQFLDSYDSASGVFEWAHLVWDPSIGDYVHQDPFVERDHQRWEAIVMNNNKVPSNFDLTSLQIGSYTYNAFQFQGFMETENVLIRTLPWFYLDPSRNDGDAGNGVLEQEVVFDSVVSIKTLYNSGRASVSKGGHITSFDLYDPTVVPDVDLQACNTTIQGEDGCD